MAVVLRKRGSSRVFWVAFYAEGRQVWERVGTDRREAEALDRQRKREVREGTYAANVRPTMTFGEWLESWLKTRRNRNAKEDTRIVNQYLLSREWLRDLKCEEMDPKHTARLVRELKETISPETTAPISDKYISNIYGLYRTAVQDARLEKIVLNDPSLLRRGTIHRAARRNVRKPYDADEVHAFLSCDDDEARMLMALALLTGMREGEVCGRRWRDWDRSRAPLGCLHVASQYDDQPLKTAKRPDEQARMVPVHPALAETLTWWWAGGFEFTYCRKPTADDFIVPRTKDGRPHTRSSAYKLFQLACSRSKVASKSLHATRHTFVSLCRNGGASGDVVEKITHNAQGEIIDQYTHHSWASLCAAVMCLDQVLDQNLDQASEPAKNKRKSVEAPGIEPGSENASPTHLRT